MPHTPHNDLHPTAHDHTQKGRPRREPLQFVVRTLSLSPEDGVGRGLADPTARVVEPIMLGHRAMQVTRKRPKGTLPLSWQVEIDAEFGDLERSDLLHAGCSGYRCGRIALNLGLQARVEQAAELLRSTRRRADRGRRKNARASCAWAELEWDSRIGEILI